MWIDATVAGSFVSDPANSVVADKVGFAMAPDTGLGKRANWLWAWSLAVPASSQNPEAAQTFISWATDKDYLALVAEGKASPTCLRGPGPRSTRTPSISRPRRSPR
jgi:sorbitol/mannitol transport system substrate-binding protein